MQALREIVRPVVDRFRDAENLRARFGAEAAAGVERLGRGPDRDSGEPRDVADGARPRRKGVALGPGVLDRTVVHLTPPESRPEM